MNFDRSAIEAHIRLLHDLAAGCGNGVLILAPIWEARNPVVQKFPIGHARQMLDATLAFDGVWGVNLYAAYATMRANLDPGKKGAERDVEYVFAAVSDIDNDKTSQREIAVEPSYVIESSPGNFQRIYLFDRPLPSSQAKPVLIALHAAVGGDSSQKDCSHVWRIPGTLNWPTKSKIERGRSPDPVPVTVAKPCNGVRVDPAVILALTPTQKPKKAATVQERDSGGPFNTCDLPEFPKTPENGQLLRAALNSISADDRDVWLKILAALKTLEPVWGEAARVIADWWSKKSAKFDSNDQAKTWTGLKGDRPDGVTVSSLFYLARESGWKDPRREPPAPDPLNILNLASLHGKPVPKREWLVPEVIPANQVTICSGNGGEGKSLLMLQLAVATATETGWIGFSPVRGGVLYISAEDEHAEIHRRVGDIISGRDDLTFKALHSINVVDLTVEDALLAIPEKDGTLKTTALYDRVTAAVIALGPKLMIIDASADVYGGDENVRAQVRQFIGVLRRLAINYGVTVVLIAHPSLYGMNSGEGTSGNTGWRNSVRGMLYLAPVKAASGEEPDLSLKQLTIKKNNRGPAGTSVQLRWERGRFVRLDQVSAERLLYDASADEAFLALVERLESQGRDVSDKVKANNYAPLLFSKEPDNGGFRKGEFEAAMRRLFQKGRIKVEKIGPAWRQIGKIILVKL